MGNAFLFCKKSLQKFCIIFSLFALILSQVNSTNNFSFRLTESHRLSVGEKVASYIFRPLLEETKNLLQYTEIKLALKAVKILYEPVTRYAFFNPKISIQCQCKCASDYLPSCHAENRTLYEECQNSENETSICYNYYFRGFNDFNCPKHFQICCEVYFSASLNEKFHAVKLIKRNVIYEMEVLNEDFPGIVQKINVFENMNKILIDNVLIEWKPTFQEMEIPNDAWFIENKSPFQSLQYTNNMNEVTEENLKKLGWFQLKDSSLRISQANFDKHFKVEIVNCNKIPPDFKWHLEATDYKPEKYNFTPNTFKNIQLERFNNDSESTNNYIFFNQPIAEIEFNLSRPTLQENPFRAYLKKDNSKEPSLCVAICVIDTYNVFIYLNQTNKIIRTFYPDKESASISETFCTQISSTTELVHPLWVCLRKVNEVSNTYCRMVEHSSYSNNFCHVNDNGKASKKNNSKIKIMDEHEEIKKNSQNTSDNQLTIVIVLEAVIIGQLLIFLLIWFVRNRDKKGKMKETEDIFMEIYERRLQQEEYGSESENLLNDVHSENTIESLKTRRRCSSSSRRNSTCQELEDILNSIQQKQLKNYAFQPLEISRWICGQELRVDNVFVDLEMYRFNENNNGDQALHYPSSNLLGIQEIFNNANDKNRGNKILIEGEPGCGKTTLLLKMVDDWVKKMPYIFDPYRMIFFFYLRNCTAEDVVENLIKVECAKIGNNIETVFECIQKYEEKVLFLFDGYDKMNDKLKASFQSFLKNKDFSKSTVIITCRKGFANNTIHEEEEKDLGIKKKIINDKLNHLCQCILIKGISEKNRLTFLKKYFDCERIDPFMNCFAYAHADLCRRPLFLFFLTNLASKINVESIKTKTVFYKFLLNFVVRWNLYREGKIPLTQQEIELFDDGHPSYHKVCAQQICNFGRLSLEHLLEKQTIFTQKEINACCGEDGMILKLGFLSKCLPHTNTSQEICYEPIHISLLEVFAAYYLSRLGAHPSSQKEFKKHIESLISKKINPSNVSYLYPCLAGLLNTHSQRLFVALSSWTMSCKDFENTVSGILNEIEDPKSRGSTSVFLSQLFHNKV